MHILFVYMRDSAHVILATANDELKLTTIEVKFVDVASRCISSPLSSRSHE